MSCSAPGASVTTMSGKWYLLFTGTNKNTSDFAPKFRNELQQNVFFFFFFFLVLFEDKHFL